MPRNHDETTTAWHNNDGTLSRRQQYAEAAHIITAQLAALPHAVAALITGHRDLAPTSLAPYAPPTAPMCRHAEQLAAATYSRPLLNHVYRCWLWAAIIADHDNMSFDADALYCAALLHDIGLAHNAGDLPPSSTPGCFTVTGAQQAATLLDEWGAPTATIDRVTDAIITHFNARVPTRSSNEAQLLHDAAYLDVVGIGVQRTSPAERDAVLDVHPRTGFAAEFTAALKHEKRARPHSRAALSYRLGAGVAIKLNPLEHIRQQKAASPR
ncbi:HD domain-containing protein [Gordonia shandongensis]|uniref:HD domain-containing protein n=1 Tax=Gordonia shandongensis TaxID=376351 RepID=UPI00041438F4|nr:HD domain-containing protein [Gordonia shandongensis]